jgi:hypothetical protein
LAQSRKPVNPPQTMDLNLLSDMLGLHPPVRISRPVRRCILDAVFGKEHDAVSNDAEQP